MHTSKTRRVANRPIKMLIQHIYIYKRLDTLVMKCQGLWGLGLSPEESCSGSLNFIFHSPPQI